MKEISRRTFLKGLAAGTAGLALSGMTTAFADNGIDEVAEETFDVVKTVSTDFLVIGSGITGLTGAIQAAQLGMDVVVIEKNGFIGGSSNVAEGIFGMGSQVQKDENLLEGAPSAAALLKQIQEYCHYNNNAAAVQHMIAESGDNIDWLVSMGCPISKNDMVVESIPNLVFRHSYGPERGAGTIKALTAKVEEMDIPVLFSTSAKKLITKDGAVVGAYAESADGMIQINAKGILVATGGYSGNPDMLKKYAHVASGDFIKDCGIAGRTGDGINMMLDAGAAEWRHMGVLQNFGPILKNDTYSSHLYTATAVSGYRFNEQGKRYGDESLDVSNFPFSGNVMQQQKASYSIASEAQIQLWASEGGAIGGGMLLNGLVPLDKLIDQLNKELESKDPQVIKCDTLDEVAKAANVEAETLKADIAHYNELCANGEDTDFMKQIPFLVPVDENGPYYLFIHKIGLFSTCDGISVNEYAQVLNPDGDVIPGLFAGGTDAGGMLGDAYDACIAPGSTQAWCVYCGRTSARITAENL